MKKASLIVLSAIVCNLANGDSSPPAVTRPIGIRAGSTVYRANCRDESACNAEVARICTKGNFITAWGGIERERSTNRPYGLEFVCRPSKLLAADYVATQPEIQVFIRPECKDMFYGPDFVELDANGIAVRTEKRVKPDYAPWDPGRATPMSYKDPETLITFYVESDGRHVAAIDADGKLLWVRNPWEDSPVFCQYRTPRPVVDSLKKTELPGDPSYLKSRGANLEHTFLELQFDSSQYGLLDESTGNFFPEGQN
jgi:hypothetical protein